VIPVRPAAAGTRFPAAVASLALLAASAVPALAGDLTAGGGTRSRFNVVLTDRLAPWVAGQASGTPGLVLDAGLLAIDTRVTPVSWLSVSAVAAPDGVHLSWTVTPDSDPVGFLVERLSGSDGDAGRTYVRLSPEPLPAATRDFVDTNPPASPTATYRLVGIDRQGRTFHTEPLTIDLAVAPLPFAVAAPAPNPAAGRTALTLDLPAPGPVRLRAFDIAGRLVGEAFDATLPAGRHQLTWDAGAAAAGVYFLRVEAAGRHEVRRVVVTR
jgi:hypothetical protein